LTNLSPPLRFQPGTWGRQFDVPKGYAGPQRVHRANADLIRNSEFSETLKADKSRCCKYRPKDGLSTHAAFCRPRQWDASVIPRRDVGPGDSA